MIQRTIKHLLGYFQVCRVCGREPKHIESRGRTNCEPQRQPGEPVVRHALECRCGSSTARYASLAMAEGEWGDKWAQQPLPLMVPLRRRRRASA